MTLVSIAFCHFQFAFSGIHTITIYTDPQNKSMQKHPLFSWKPLQPNDTYMRGKITSTQFYTQYPSLKNTSHPEPLTYLNAVNATLPRTHIHTSPTPPRPKLTPISTPKTPQTTKDNNNKGNDFYSRIQPLTPYLIITAFLLSISLLLFLYTYKKGLKPTKKQLTKEKATDLS